MTPKFIFTAVPHGAVTLQLANIQSVKFTAVTESVTKYANHMLHSVNHTDTTQTAL